MIIERQGWVIAMIAQPNPEVLHYHGGLFGPATSFPESESLSENLSTNGLEIFRTKYKAFLASNDRRKRYGPEGYKVDVARIELRITEKQEEWESLRHFGSYVVALHGDMENVDLYGAASIKGKRVEAAFDSRAPFYQNGFTPFTDFGLVVGEKGLGVLQELSRQTMSPASLIGLKLDLPRGF